MVYVIVRNLLVAVKVAEDDIPFKLAIFFKSLPWNDNTGFCGIWYHSSVKISFGVFIGKK